MFQCLLHVDHPNFYITQVKVCAIGGKGQSALKDEKNEFPIIKWPGIHLEIIFSHMWDHLQRTLFGSVFCTSPRRTFQMNHTVSQKFTLISKAQLPPASHRCCFSVCYSIYQNKNLKNITGTAVFEASLLCCTKSFCGNFYVFYQ